ncbi:MAG: ECF transporter S component [Eubacteriales bacterium]|nr:ECF transporter S component [Eubacteriales bacterium]
MGNKNSENSFVRQEEYEPAHIMSYSRKRTVRWGIALVGAAVLVLLGVKLWADRKYHLISFLIALLSCFLFYFSYEKREGSIRRIVLIAVMTVMAIVGRLLFMPVPAIKPVGAIVILTGIYMGPEAGFLVGSLTAVISGMTFGQGPWVAFQMVAWGLNGFIAGLPGLRFLLRKRIPLILYGIWAGIQYSLVMDIWTLFSLDGTFAFGRYLAVLGTVVPYMLAYAAANVVFLLLMVKPLGEKLQRIQIKHGIF